jgi:hypothetical protein
MNPVVQHDISRHEDSPYEVSPHDLRYARWMQRGAVLGFVLLLLSYALYLGGALEPAVDLQRLPQLWTLPVAQYLQASGSRDGWYWLSQLHQGDYLNVLGIAVLASVTPLCYLAVLPGLWRAGEHALAWIAIAELLVLLCAAAGVLSA